MPAIRKTYYEDNINNINALIADGLKRNGLSPDDLIDYLGIGRTTYYRRMKDGQFTIVEFQSMIRYLKLSDSEIVRIARCIMS